MLSNELKYRIDELFVDNFFEKDFMKFEFEESSKGGEMKLNITTNNFSLGITGLDDSAKKSSNKMSKPKSNFLKLKNCADHIVFEFVETNKCILHIFEMKASIGAKKWVDPVKKQFKGAYLQCCSIAACLGVTIEKTIFYIVYVNDRFYSENVNTETDPKTLYAEHGKWRPKPQDEWKDSEVFLNFSKYKKFKLSKIEAKIGEGYPFPQAKLEIN